MLVCLKLNQILNSHENSNKLSKITQCHSGDYSLLHNVYWKQNMFTLKSFLRQFLGMKQGYPFKKANYVFAPS